MRNFKCISNGKYIFSAWWYVPANADPLQRSYLMLLNQPYTQPGSFSMQVGANSGTVIFAPAGGQTVYSNAGPLTTKTNQWVNVCAFIDLKNDRVKVYYDGQFLADARWRANPTQSLLQVYAVNVYGGDLGGTSWVDDLALVRDCPKPYLIGKQDNFANGPDTTPVSSALQVVLNPFAYLFDQLAFDGRFGASFMGLPSGPCKNFKGRFRSRMSAHPSAASYGYGNFDRLYLGLTPSNSWAYNESLGVLTSTTWSTAGPQNVDVNLNGSVLAAINATGRLDFMTSAFTGADYARLWLWNCCPYWKGFWWDTIGTADIDFNDVGNLVATFPNGPGGIGVDLGTSSGGTFTFGVSPHLDDPTF